MYSLLSKIPGTSAWHRRRLRCAMRGYRALKASARLGVIGDVKHELTLAPISTSVGKFDPAVLGAVQATAELALRQYLLIQLAGVSLNRVLLRAAADRCKPVVYPLPGEWRRIVGKHGFRVSEWRCAVYWAAYVAVMFGYGSLRALRILLTGAGGARPSVCSEDAYVYFLDLSAANLPQAMDGRRSHDIVSWFAQWAGRDPAVGSVRHGVLNAPSVSLDGLQVVPQATPFPPLAGTRERLAYLQWALRAFVKSAIDVLSGRWWHAVMLSHAALAAQVRYLPAQVLARTYFFHNSGWIYRPFWTYEAERKGSGIVMYFYSTNAEPFKRPDGYPHMYYGYRAMNWPSYLVWDEYQADFVRRATTGNGQVDVVGPIWFQGVADALTAKREVSVAVFDVTPTRASWYRTLALDPEFYVPSTVNAFLGDVWREVSRHQGRMLWKRKRSIGKMAHPLYRDFAECLGRENCVELVDPSVSALKVIEAATVTISLPFTSTALLARHLGKPSAYYDPTGMVLPDDRAAHGIPLLSGPSQLAAWLQASLSEGCSALGKAST